MTTRRYLEQTRPQTILYHHYLHFIRIQDSTQNCNYRNERETHNFFENCTVLVSTTLEMKNQLKLIESNLSIKRCELLQIFVFVCLVLVGVAGKETFAF